MGQVTHFDATKRSVREALESALAEVDTEGTDSVVVVAFSSEADVVHVRSSKMKDTVKVIGSLEVAKAHILEGW